MSENLIQKYFFLLFSLIPISIVVGSTASLANILIIVFSFIIYLIYLKEWNWLFTPTIKLLFILYLYLIFNSFISLDIKVGIYRNFGFIRFIILFAAFNYFFHNYKNFKNILFIWSIFIIIVCFDVYLESFTGSNIFGYGEDYGRRVVSFFKDEAIVGGYLNGFFLLLLGYVFSNYKELSYKQKLLIFTVSFFFLLAIILTGERANSIKAFIGFFIFYGLIKDFSLKNKIVLTFIILILLLMTYSKSEYLKSRYTDQFKNQISSKEKLKILFGKNIYLNLYYSGFKVFKNYPIFGVGNKNYRIETCKVETKIYNYLCITHPHQVYFEFLSEHGIFGSIILLYIFFFLMFKMLRVIINSKNQLQIGCLVYSGLTFIPLIPSGSFFSDYNATLFWINFSVMYAVGKETNIFRKI